MNTYPLVSVLMPVYNAEKYLAEAIESILNQTYPHFELLLLNDGSTDASAAIIGRYHDNRLRVMHSPENIGLIAQLNKGLALATGQYIARMDADDISLPNRLEKQVGFMEAHPEVGILGSAINHFKHNKIIYTETFALEHDKIKSFLIFDTPFAHPAVIMRRQVLLANNLSYQPQYQAAEDYKFWLDMLLVTQGANLAEPLLLYRDSGTQVSKQHQSLQVTNAGKIRAEAFQLLSLQLTPEEFNYHNQLWYHPWEPNELFFSQAINWFTYLLEANNKRKLLLPAALGYTLGLLLFRQCLQHAAVGFNAFKIYQSSPLYAYYQPTAAALFKLRWAPFYRHANYYFRYNGSLLKQKLKKLLPLKN
ncbi:glycosyltransferase [Adhaeribacter rhizoryzae]|uniref:Glycosyltransferase n=1 Tax=Adhaeribacter rhizoryzae TaxID=2607907 RepID=A0A5M6DCU8_9BACT|nr:glycosyltransferase [Adhaeribacter rhizoryzae]KAA5544220.1 glycosyltransferase [Adhaeribacter rhizoryzae]